MVATLSRFAFLVEGRMGPRGFYRHFDVAADDLVSAKAVASAVIAKDGGSVSGFDDVVEHGPAPAMRSPRVMAVTGYSLFPLPEA